MTEAAIDWHAKLPEGMRKSKLVTDAKTEEVFWKRIEDQQRFLGNSIQIPSTDASPEQWADFSTKIKQRVPTLMDAPREDDEAGYETALTKLGRPEKPEKYSLAAIEGMALPEAQLAGLRNMAHESGLTQKQFVKMVRGINKEVAESQKAHGGMKDKERGALQKEWGATFDDRLAGIERFLTSSKAPQAIIEQVKAGNIPAEQMRWLHDVSGKMGEGSSLAGDGGALAASSNGKIAPADAEMRLNEIYTNKTHPFHHPGNPGYRAAVERVIELMRFANP